MIEDSEVRHDIRLMTRVLRENLPSALLGYVCKHEFSNDDGQRLNWAIFLRDIKPGEMQHVAANLVQHWHEAVPKANATAFNLPRC